MEGMEKDISGGKPKFPLNLNQTALRNLKINNAFAAAIAMAKVRLDAPFLW